MPLGWIIVLFSVAACAVATAWWLAVSVLAGWWLLLALSEAVYWLLQKSSPRYQREVIFARRIQELGGEASFVGFGMLTIDRIDLSAATVDDAQLVSIAENSVFLEGLWCVDVPFSRFSSDTIRAVERKIPLFDSESPE